MHACGEEDASCHACSSDYSSGMDSDNTPSYMEPDTHAWGIQQTHGRVHAHTRIHARTPSHSSLNSLLFTVQESDLDANVNVNSWINDDTVELAGMDMGA